MAATQTLAQSSKSHNPIVSKHGVATLFGYGIQVRVDRGHILLQDGIAADRREVRLPRVGGGLKRLVVIGSDGMVSLSALRWLADQNAAFVMLNRDGSVLVTTGPVRPSDVRLRRAQAISPHTETALQIARELINQKLLGQERVVREKFVDSARASNISGYRAELVRADTFERIRLIESLAASSYWSVFHDLPICFPKKDEPRVPEHWRTFGPRVSPLTGSPRLAVNPPNAILNFLYAILESECSLAAAALGLDPGLGVLHVDTKARDSLACDLMEAIRPQIDAFLLDWIMRDPLKREWFFEERNGNCRLNASMAIRLSETAPTWAKAIAPIAELVAHMFWVPTARRDAIGLPTRLTQRHKREAKGASQLPPSIPPPCAENVCRGCGKPIQREHRHCGDCARALTVKRMVDVARAGRLSANSPQAQAKRRNTQRRNGEAGRSWRSSSQPTWLTEGFYSEKIQPVLAKFSGSAIGRAIGVSAMYGSRIRQGYRPHPRHWLALAQLTEISLMSV